MGDSAEQISAWLEQAAQNLKQGKAAAANRLLRRVLDWHPEPGLARGMELWRGNQPHKAAQALADYSAGQGTDFRALQLRAHLASEYGDIDEAIRLLQDCLHLQPGLNSQRHQLCQLLTRRQRYAEAIGQADILLQADSHSDEYLMLKAALLDRSGQYPEAIALLQQVIRLQSESSTTANSELASTWVALAMLYRTVGNQAAAIDGLQRAIELDSRRGWPWYQLADFKTWTFTQAQTEQIHKGLDQAAPGSMNEVHFAFALGRALESQQDVAGAFAAYQRGNQVRKALAPFDMAAFQRELTATRSLFSQTFANTAIQQAAAECPAIFVVGLPRSGTTLVDQIITAHSQVDGTMELQLVGTLIRELQQRQLRAGQVPYPAPGTVLSPDQLHDMGEEYLQRARIQRGNAPFFVDKMPFNFQHIGLIRRILPGARIVNVRRDPMAVCFSIYRQLFRFGQDWAFDLTQIGQYYLAYLEMMQHWDHLEPGSIIHVRYEELVQSPRPTIQLLLHQLRLSEEEPCFRPHESKRPVRTASSEQVRQSLYTDAIDYWRPYEQHLEPLRKALGAAAGA